MGLKNKALLSERFRSSKPPKHGSGWYSRNPSVIAKDPLGFVNSDAYRKLSNRKK